MLSLAEVENVESAAAHSVFFLFGLQGFIGSCSRKDREKVRVVAMDARGYGLSSSEDDSDLSAEAWCCLLS
jgi:hypothetical protein